MIPKYDALHWFSDTYDVINPMARSLQKGDESNETIVITL